jgi:hypothetical protein
MIITTMLATLTRNSLPLPSATLSSRHDNPQITSRSFSKQPTPITHVGHKLKECTMMKNYMTTGTFAKGKKPEGDSTGKVVAPFPEEKVVLSNYGGSTPQE